MADKYDLIRGLTGVETPRAPAKRKDPRENLKAIISWHLPEVRKQLKEIALHEGVTTQALMEEALNDLFLKKGRPAIA
jgi:hypothetical protein